MKKKIALFHPWIKSRGGAERVVLEILKSKKYDFDVYTWVYDKNKTFKEFKKFKIKIIAPKIAKKISRHYLLRGLFFPISLFSKIPLEKYDAFLISTSGLAELITFRNYKPDKTFAYVHTILRATCEEDVGWNLKYRYKNVIKKLIYLFAVKFYRVLERISWRKIDAAIFNSELSLERAEKHRLLKNKKTHIVYPPVDVERFKKLKTKKGDYFLYISRFHPSKRQDLLIKAWSKFVKVQPNYKLVLAGNIEDKRYFEEIKKLAAQTENIEIRIAPNEGELKRLYANCLACVFIPFGEDFGIIPFEVLAIGKPLIAVNKGGYVNLIRKKTKFYEIEEKIFSEKMELEVYKMLKKFSSLKVRDKKVIFDEFSRKNFTKKIESILKG